MEVIICRDKFEVGEKAAELIAKVISEADQPVLGLATGSSPMETYQSLQKRVEDGQLDLSNVRGFALDEYVRIDPNHPESYAQVIKKTVVEPMKMNPELVQVPNGNAEDLPQACLDYDRAIKEAGGVDIQILGIGSNGHIGFNEPGSSFASRTRPKTLTRQTREDNKRFFKEGETTPTHCLTQGLGTIMEAKNLVLVATGENKADAIKGCVEGPVSASCPASILQFHQHATVIVDEAAAAKLDNADYFRFIAENKSKVH